jgi:branched-chain amino acid transport system substrate-binding protein
MNEATRAFSKRFVERHPQHIVPNDMQAGVYAAVLHYLKAVDKVGGAQDGKAVVAARRTSKPTILFLVKDIFVATDGRFIPCT